MTEEEAGMVKQQHLDRWHGEFVEHGTTRLRVINMTMREKKEK
jgi:hypothetical protein